MEDLDIAYDFSLNFIIQKVNKFNFQQYTGL